MSSYQSIIIIGAPRSGTNMLRDMLTELPEAATWPCDEINYIWRHGNIRYPSDEFSPALARPGVQSFIRGQFDQFARHASVPLVVEKTCANSLRVGFVNKVIPDARYLFIVRDGMDAVASALKRWRASLDIPYVMKKARYVPAGDLPYYALRYLKNHAIRLVSREHRLSFWGPSLDHMDDLLRTYTLPEVCALQWKACVDRAEQDFAMLPADRVHRIQYEAFVQNPVAEFERATAFIGTEVASSVTERVARRVNANSVGKGRKAMGAEVQQRVRPLIAETLQRYGYA